MVTAHSVARRRSGGFALPEVMISTLIFAAVSTGLLLGFTSLERSYAAAASFAMNHSDQMRISDSIAQDLRRATSVRAAQNDTTIYMPSYYDATGTPQTPTLDGKGGVIYGAVGSAVQAHYYLSAGTIYRQQDTRTPVALAVNVRGFLFNVTDAGKVVTTRIVFSPNFTSGITSDAATTATAFYNTTLLRNSRTDIQSAVY